MLVAVVAALIWDKAHSDVVALAPRRRSQHGRSVASQPAPFPVAVMMAGSAAFATPFGYQTNALVYEMRRYRSMDFVRLRLPLNLVTWVTAVLAIRIFFPF